jgi:AraC-like DNA-binding protein
LVICLSGAARLVLDSEEGPDRGHTHVTLLPGRLVLVPAGEFHYETFARRSRPFTLVWVVFAPEVVLVSRTLYNRSGKNWTAVTLDHPQARMAAANFLREIELELAGARPFLEVRACALLTDLLVQLSRNLADSPAQRPDSTAAQRWHRALIREAVRYLEDNFTRPVSVREIASRLHLSPNYLSTLFHRECGQTLRGYLVRLRVERARRLLRETDHPIKAIAGLAGFSDEYYFSRVFRRTLGHPPGAFRASEKSAKPGGAKSIVNPGGR